MTNFERLVRDVKTCQNLITGIRNYRNLLEKQDLTKTEGELLELKFRPDNKKGVKLDAEGFILRGEDESIEDFVERLSKLSTEFNKTIATTEWLNEQLDN